MKNLKYSIFCVFLVGVVSCTRQAPQEQAGDADQREAVTDNKTVVFCSEGPPSRLNPQVEVDGTTYNITKAIYSTLATFENGTTTIISHLAEDWDISDNGLEYTFRLKKGVKFHTTPYFTPTRDFNADDVLFSIQRQHDSQHPYHEIGGGIYEYFTSMNMNKLIKSIEKINDYTVKITLTEPNAAFIANTTMDFLSIISKEYADKLMEAGSPEKIDHEPIGTGPYVFVSHQKDAQVRLKAFPEYFGKKGNVQNLVHAITPDPSVRLQKIKSNECQIMIYPNVADLESIRKDKDLELLGKESLNLSYVAMNVKKKPFDNKLVRQAINHALNKESYIQSVYQGNAKSAKNPIPPTLWSYNDKIKDYDYNIEKAKNLLKQAGLPNGFKTDLWVLPVARPYLPSGRRLGEMMQNDLAKIGVEIKLVSYDWPTYLDKIRRKEHAFVQSGWLGDNGDPDNFLYYLLSCQGVKDGANYANWCHKSYDNLVTKAQETSKINERTALYEKAQEIFKEEAPWIPIAHSMNYRVIRKGLISNYKVPVVGSDVLDFIEVK